MEHRHPQPDPPHARPGAQGHGHDSSPSRPHAQGVAGQAAGQAHDDHPHDHDHDHDGHGHGHHHHGPGGHSHVPAEIRHEKPLWWALALTATVLAAEAVGAWMTNSLALLSDAAHMATDTLALGIALVAVRLARRPPDARRTYGYARFEALGALANGTLLFLLAGYIL